MNNIDRTSLPSMPSSFNRLVSDVHARLPGHDGRRLFGLLYAALIAELAGHDKRHRGLESSALKLPDSLYESAAICHAYYCDDMSTLTKKFGALLGIQPRNDDFFAYIGSDEDGEVSPDNRVRQVDLMLRRLKQEEEKAARRNDQPSQNSASNAQPLSARIHGLIGKLWTPKKEK